MSDTDDKIIKAYCRIRKLIDSGAFLTCESGGSDERYEVRAKFRELEEAQELHGLLLGLPVKERV